jgi:hypothetical protein
MKSNANDLADQLLKVAQRNQGVPADDPRIRALLRVWEQLFGPPSRGLDLPRVIGTMLGVDSPEQIAEAFGVAARSTKVADGDQLGRLRFARAVLRKRRAEPSLSRPR